MARFRWLVVALLAVLLAACSGSTSSATQPTPTSPPNQGSQPAGSIPSATAEAVKIELDSITFAKGLTDTKAAVDPTETFLDNETVYLVVTLKGRPSTGIVKAKFYLRDTLISEAEVDLADAASSAEQTSADVTNVGYTLTHEKPFPLGKNYHAEVFYNDKKLVEQPWSVVPPDDAIPSKVAKALLAKGATDDYQPVDPATTFGPQDTVYLVGSGDFGLRSWLQADWYVDGKIVDEGTRSLTLEENARATGFSFSFLPEGGWPVGQHEVKLTLDDVEVDTYQFTIDANGAAAPNESGAAGDTITKPGTDSSPSDDSAGASPVNNLPELTLAQTESYRYPTGLFQIDIPQDWDKTEQSDAKGAYVFWLHPTGLSTIAVFINERDRQLTEEQLTEELTHFIKVVRAEEDAEISAPEVQTDGSVLIGWTFGDRFGDQPFRMQAVGYIEQRENKLSIITVDVPVDQYERYWKAGLSTVINSYKLDASAPLSN